MTFSAGVAVYWFLVVYHHFMVVNSCDCAVDNCKVSLWAPVIVGAVISVVDYL